jgi:hypothetical protein
LYTGTNVQGTIYITRALYYGGSDGKRGIRDRWIFTFGDGGEKFNTEIA